MCSVWRSSGRGEPQAVPADYRIRRLIGPEVACALHYRIAPAIKGCPRSREWRASQEVRLRLPDEIEHSAKCAYAL